MARRGLWQSVAIVAVLGTMVLAVTPELAPVLRNPEFEEGEAGWTLEVKGDAMGAIEVEAGQPYAAQGPHSLKWTIEKVSAGGSETSGMKLVNAGVKPLRVEKGKAYEVQFVARKAAGGVSGGGAVAGIGLVFSLESADGKVVAASTTIPEIGRATGGPAREDGVMADGWQVYSVTLDGHADLEGARLTIEPIDAGTLWLDHVSLQPKGMSPSLPERKDVVPAMVVAATGPGRGRGGRGPAPDPAVAERMLKQGSRGVQVHDPSTVVKCGEEYWCFTTGRGVPSLRSKDLVTWTRGPQVFGGPLEWVGEAVPRNRSRWDFWAPDVIKVGEQYLVFYSASSFGSNVSAIGVARNATLNPEDPAFKWVDGGEVIRSWVEDDFNAIDPAVTLDGQGRLWMSFGSFWGGIKLIELDPKTGKRIAADSPIYPLAHFDSIEASYIHRHGDYYYLFVSWGMCCRGAASTYHTRVGRSKAITGPYLDKEGKDMLVGGGTVVLPAKEGAFAGPGHAGIVADGAGKEWFSFHFYDLNRNGQPTLGIRPLTWSADGWPVVVTPSE